MTYAELSVFETSLTIREGINNYYLICCLIYPYDFCILNLMLFS